MMGRRRNKFKTISNSSHINIMNNSPFLTNNLKHIITPSPKHSPSPPSSPNPNRSQINQLLITLSHNPNNYHPTRQQHLNYSHSNPNPQPSKPQSSPFSTLYHLTQQSVKRPSSPPMMTFSEDQM